MPRARPQAVHFVTFRACLGKTAENDAPTPPPGGGQVDCPVTRQRTVPGGGEQPVRVAGAKPIGAFPAHARRARGPGHAAGPGKHVEEDELAVRRPAVPSDAVRTGAALGFVRLRLHPPAWSMKLWL